MVNNLTKKKKKEEEEEEKSYVWISKRGITPTTLIEYGDGWTKIQRVRTYKD